MTEVYDQSLNYSPSVSNHSSILYRNISPQSSSSQTLSVTSTVGPVEFVISPQVFNFSKSSLNFNLQIAGTNAANTRVWTDANLLSTISRITVYDSLTSAVLCDVSNCDKFYQMVSSPSTSFKDFMSKPSDNGVPKITSTLANVAETRDIARTNTITNYNGSNVDCGTSIAPYIGKRLFYVSPVEAGAGEGLACFNVVLPFESFKFTALSLDKMCYSPSNLVISVYFNAVNQFAFTATSATDATSATASIVNAVSVSNLGISLATEQNLSIVNQIISKTMSSGLTLPIAYPTVTRQSISASTAHSFSLQITRAYGSRILGIVTAPFSGTTTNNTAQSHTRGDIQTYNTYLNSVAILNPAGINALKSEDWKYNASYFEGSTLQNPLEYSKANWVHIDSFGGSKPLYEIEASQTSIDGLDVTSQNSTWSIQANLAASTAYVWISAIVGQKMLSFTSAGTMVQ